MIEKIIKGIVLEKVPFEDENIIRILSEGGNIVSLKAKGLDKFESKNRMSLNLFNIVEVEYFSAPMNSNSGRLKRATAEKEFLGNSDLALNLTNVLRNVLLSIDSHSKVTYETTVNILNSVENNTFTFQKLWALFILILRNEGYNPIIDRCVKCGTNQQIKAFSLYEGGLICENHDEAVRYKMTGSFLRKVIEIHSLKNPIECKELDLSPEEIKKLKSMYKMFFENQIGASLYLIERI